MIPVAGEQRYPWWAAGHVFSTDATRWWLCEPGQAPASSPNHIREQFERIEELDDSLAALEPIGAVREWLRQSELHAIKQASERGASLARIGNALGTDKQNIHQKLRTTSNAKGFTSPEFDGVTSSTLRYWLWWWSRPERSVTGVDEKGRDP